MVMAVVKPFGTAAGLIFSDELLGIWAVSVGMGTAVEIGIGVLLEPS